MSNLKRIREEKGITQKELSLSANVNQRSIQKYEQGLRNINLATAISVYKMSKVLGCQVADILEEIDSAENVSLSTTHTK